MYLHEEEHYLCLFNLVLKSMETAGSLILKHWGPSFDAVPKS